MSTRGGSAISNGQQRPDRARLEHAVTATPVGPKAVPSFDTVFVEEYPKMVALAAAVSGRRTFVAALPGKQRAAVALRYLEDRSIDEIADVLEIAPSTVRVHLHRAAQSLRQRLPDFDLRPLEPPDQGGETGHDTRKARP